MQWTSQRASAAGTIYIHTQMRLGALRGRADDHSGLARQQHKHDAVQAWAHSYRAPQALRARYLGNPTYKVVDQGQLGLVD
jgi:hypothetical protein